MIALALTALLYGLRHGIDWDHLAAISDVTCSQERPRRGLAVATAYATGHGVVVFGLGLAAILGGELLPPAVDAVMARVVGVTLIVLAFSVLIGLLRDRRDFRLRSRWMLVASGIGRIRQRVRPRVVVIEHDHPESHHHAPSSAITLSGGGSEPTSTTVREHHRHTHVAVMPADPFVAAPGLPAALGIGVLHGIGAETPTQLVLFLTAANVAGRLEGTVLLLCFIVGIFVSNTGVAVVSAYGYMSATRRFPVYAAVAVVSGVASLVIGIVFLTGGQLPVILGG